MLFRSFTVEGSLTIDSINPLTDRQKENETNAGRPHNAQPFLVGGARIATLDNARGGATIRNKATINMVGPLVVGYEIQNDTDAAVHCVIAGSGVARRRVRAPHAQRAPRAAQAQPGLAAPGAGGVHSAVFQADAAFKLELGAQAAALRDRKSVV